MSPPEQNAPSSRKAVGRTGEAAAVRFLEAKGYQMVARNWHAGRAGEMDIIAHSPDSQILAFIEVKTRRTRTCGLPVEAVDKRKCAQMLRVAEAYLAAHYPEVHPQVRFDVIAVSLQGTRLHIEHLENVIN